MKKVHAYTVNWRDSASLRGWQNLANAPEFGEAVITTIGWLIHETKTAITITTSISERGSVMDALTIPREAITKMQKLKNYIADNSAP